MAKDKDDTVLDGGTANSKEGAHLTTDSEGNTHETKWYANDYASYRTSRDIDKDGNESDKHTKKN